MTVIFTLAVLFLCVWILIFFAGGVAVIDDKYSIINLTDELSTSSCSNLFTDRATYILLAVDSKH